MPRALQLKASQIVKYFATAELAVAVMVLDLAREAVEDRKKVGRRIGRGKTKKQKAPAPVPAPAPAATHPAKASAKKVAKATKRRRRPGPKRAPADVPLDLEPSGADLADPQETYDPI
jgi:hypothetical protein